MYRWILLSAKTLITISIFSNNRIKSGDSFNLNLKIITFNKQD